MKRRVRIYKAQEGAEVTQKTIMDSVAKALMQGMTPEEIYTQLIKTGIEKNTAVALINTVAESMQGEQEEQTQEPVAQETMPEEDEYDQMAEQEQAYVDQAAEEDEMYPMAQEGQQVGNPIIGQYNSFGMPEEDTTESLNQSLVDFPGIEEYLPNYQPLAGEFEAPDYENPFADTFYSKHGGPVSKSKFVKSVMSLVKKQAGGPADNTDIPVGGRSEKLQSFIGAVKNTANNAVMKQAAEKMYGDMMQMGGFADQASGRTMFQGGGEDLDLNYTNSKNVTDPYFQYGGLPKAVLGTAQNTYGIIDINKKPQQVEEQQKGYPLYKYPTFIDPTRINRASINPFGQIFNYQKSWMKPVGGKRSFDDIQFGPDSNVQSISDIKLRRSGMPKSFTINYKSNPSATEANPAFDFMLSKHVASKEKQAETPKSNGAPTGPGVSPDADMYDGLNVRQAKRLARGFRAPDVNLKRDLKFQNPIVTDEAENFSEPRDTRFDFQIPTQPIDDSQFAPPVDWHDQIRFQNPNVVDDQEYMYGGYYAYGGGLPEYQGSVTDTKGSTVTADPKTQPSLNKAAQTAMDNIMNINTARTHVGEGVGTLVPRKATQSESIVDDQGLINVGQTPQAELEGKNESQKVKVKNEYDINPYAALNTFNTGANTLLGFLERKQQGKADRKMLGEFTADNLYADNAHIDRGTYEANSGLFRPDEMGFTGVAAYGGMFQNGGFPNPYNMNSEDLERMNTISDANMRTLNYPTNMESKQVFMNRTGLDKEPWAMTPNPMYSEQRMHGALPGMVRNSHMRYEEGGEAYMTQEEIDDFIANGGELEYLND